VKKVALKSKRDWGTILNLIYFKIVMCAGKIYWRAGEKKSSIENDFKPI
jgi:hypothetical protein